MQPIKISLVSLGSLRYPVDTANLRKWPSTILRLEHSASVGHLPDSDGSHWEYTDETLRKILLADSASDFTLGLINAQLQDNYYLRRLSNRVAVLSLHEMGEIVQYSDFTIEQYILRNAYELAILFAANGKLIPTEYTTWAHDETRGCLFDMNANKADIVFSLNRPRLCHVCRARLSTRQVPPELLPALDKELQKIGKTLFVRIAEWVKAHPVRALVVTALSAILLNVIASAIFEKAKRVLPWLG